MLLLTHAYLVPTGLIDRHHALTERMLHWLRAREVGVELVVETDGSFREVGGEWVRVVQLLRFRDTDHLERVRTAESGDSGYQKLLAELQDLVDLPGQMRSGTYVPGYYRRVLGAVGGV